jgi:hypothetical protein
MQRRTLAPLFARRTVASFTSAMLSAADLLTERWSKLEPRATVDVAAEMTLLTLNVLALALFSDGIGGDLDGFRIAMNSYFGTIGRIGALDLFGVPDFVPRPGRKRLRQTLAYFENVIDAIIELSLGGPRNHGQYAGLVGVPAFAGTGLARTGARRGRSRIEATASRAGRTAGRHPSGDRRSVAALSSDRRVEPNVGKR